MVISIASGKGGTGTTSLSAALAQALPGRVLLIDCDVEEPNCHLFIADRPGCRLLEERAVSHPVPEIVRDLCTGCGECSNFCRFNAVATLGSSVPIVFTELCHGCGGCAFICPEHAVREIAEPIGTLTRRVFDTDGTLITGMLTVGGVLTSPIIKEARMFHNSSYDFTLIDAPAGTSCSFVASVRKSDYLLFVTEPTPFGLHDLQLTVEAAKDLALPFGVVVNKASETENCITNYCRSADIPLLLQIREQRVIAEFYAQGKSMIEASPGMKEVLVELVSTIMKSVSREAVE